MENKEKKVGKAKSRDPYRHQRREMARRIREACAFTTDELLKEITEHPDGELSVSVCVDFLWERVCKKSGLQPPVRPDGMSDDDWKKEQAAFGLYVEREKGCARLWYLLGLRHHRTTHRQFIDALQSETKTQEGEKVGQL